MSLWRKKTLDVGWDGSRMCSTGIKQFGLLCWWAEYCHCELLLLYSHVWCRSFVRSLGLLLLFLLAFARLELGSTNVGWLADWLAGCECVKALTQFRDHKSNPNCKSVTLSAMHSDATTTTEWATFLSSLASLALCSALATNLHTYT